MTLSKYLSKAEQLTKDDIPSRTGFLSNTKSRFGANRLSGSHGHGDHHDESLADDLHALIDSAEDFLQSTASYSGAEIEAARARVVSQLDSAREQVRKHRRSRVARRAVEIAETSGRYVSEHKWQSAGILAAAAALAGGLYAGLKWSGRDNQRE